MILTINKQNVGKDIIQLTKTDKKIVRCRECFFTNGFVRYSAETMTAQSMATWAGRRRMLDVSSERFAFSVDIWYLGGEVQNGFGCYCTGTLQDLGASGASISSKVTIKKTSGGG